MNLLKAAATVCGMTMLSRITGLIRENLTASIFGASSLTDAFFVAFRLPNLLRRLFAEGAFSQAFVPMLAQARKGDPAQTRRLIDQIATALCWTVLAISLLGMLAAPWLVWLMATGLQHDPAAFDAATTMTRMMFPYILFMSLIALSAGILNTWQRFMVPAFTPVLLNLSFIVAALGLSRFFDPPVYALAAGVLIGGVAQLAIQIPALRKLGMLPRIGLNVRAAFRDPATREVMTLMGPAVFSVSVSQLSLIINTNIASRLPAGSVSWVNYGDRLMEFPSALLGVALGTVLLPSLSRAGASGNHAEYSGLLDWGLRLCVLLSVPCMVGLAMMAEPLTAMLFHYGRFTAHDVAMTRQAVLGYSVGLLGLIAIKVLAPGFYARKDVRTPVKIGVFALVLTQLLNLLLVPFLQHAGLTLSISLAALVNAGLMLVGLRRRGTYRPAAGWWGFIARITLAGLAMAGLLALTVSRFDWIALHDARWERIGLTLALVAGAGLAYAAVLVALGIRPRQFLRRSIS
ncbi:MAG: murein biosynthesis integral membrane protein MurJ [Burkholderiaceae bacterium]